jgi:hypothetical protein
MAAGFTVNRTIIALPGDKSASAPRRRESEVSISDKETKERRFRLPSSVFSLGKRDYLSEKACGNNYSFFAAGESLAAGSDTLAVKQVHAVYRVARNDRPESLSLVFRAPVFPEPPDRKEVGVFVHADNRT